MSGFELHLRSYITVTVKINQCFAMFDSPSESDQVLMRKAHNFTGKKQTHTIPLRIFQKTV